HNNHWLIDRGDGRPSVNLVVLSFVNPLRLLNGTTDAQTLNGTPRGMTADVVNYFTSHNVRVMLSIGGITYVNDWTTALSTNATAMVPSRQPSSATVAQSNWQEHVDGKPNYAPPIPPLAPAKFTGSLFIAEGNKVRPECTNFASSLQKSTGPYVQTVAPNGAG